MNNSRRGFIKKRLVIGLGTAALIAAAIGAYSAFFRNHAPVITDLDSIPPELYVGDAFNIAAKVTDDEGAKEVLGIIEEPDGTIREIVMHRSDGSWENTYEVEKEGPHEVSVKAEDIKGKESTVYAGRVDGIPDTLPAIAHNGELPESMYIGDEIGIPFNASDKEGELEVTVTAESQGKSMPIDANKTGQDSYEAVLKPEEVGIYKLIGKAIDSRGQEATKVFGEINVKMDYFPEILNSRIPKYVQLGYGFSSYARVEDDMGIESVILEIEGVGKFVFENTDHNFWESPEKIIINRSGEYKAELIVTDSRGQEAIEEDTITVDEFGGGGGGGCGCG